MKSLFGVEYSRGATARIIDGGPLLAPMAVHKMFPDVPYTFVSSDPISHDECMRDRFGDCLHIQQKIFAATPHTPHVMIGGDHSVNFGHFAVMADRAPDQDLCLVYIDAHFDIHTPESSIAQASGAPHGTNVRALLGNGDARWLGLQARRPALRCENLFYIGSRSFEAAESEFVRENNIFVRTPDQLKTPNDWAKIVTEIQERIADRPYIVSFDFDAIDPKYFPDVLVPESNGITPDAARFFVQSFAPHAYGFEFVEYAPTGDTQSAAIAQALIQIALQD